MKKILLLSMLSIFLVACSAEDGQDGTIGPQGAQGEQGIPGSDGQNGEQGPEGEQGEPGTANVIYSEWFASEFANNINLSVDSFTVEVPGFTDEILEKGLLLVYGRTINVIDEEFVEQLPRNVFFRDQYYYIIGTYLSQELLTPYSF